jgi:radical SAM protein with 4Fe4S-binding SPASM domain
MSRDRSQDLDKGLREEVRRVVGRGRRRLVPTYHDLLRRTHELRYLFVELTLDCNLRCLHCGSDCTRDPGAASLSPKAVLNVLREIRAHERYDTHGIAVALTGGEPLCYPGLFELGREIYRLEFPWGMVTNGYGWSPAKVEQAKRAGMHSITVSLDGFAPEHNWLRGRPQSFGRAVETIRLLMADRFWQAMDVITCVNRRNVDDLEALHDLLLELGVPAWRWFTISPIGRAAELPELILSPAQYHQMMTTVERLRQRGQLPVSLSESGYHGPAHELRVRDQYYFCSAGVHTAGIMSTGDILACPNIDRRFRQGNIHTDSFVDVWENRYHLFRNRSWMKVGDCAGCSEWRMCQGNSFHLWDLDEARPRLCHCHAYELLKPSR